MITKNRIRILEGDITKQKVDAIVNAANTSLLGGGGVDGAIHRAAGPELLRACKEIGGCPTGEVRVTPGFHLPAQYVFHTAGPVWSGGGAGEPELLASCYRNCFREAEKRQVRTLAFPAISTGVYGYPLEQATQIAMQETLRFLEMEDRLLGVFFVCFDSATREMYQREFHKHFPQSAQRPAGSGSAEKHFPES